MKNNEHFYRLQRFSMKREDTTICIPHFYRNLLPSHITHIAVSQKFSIARVLNLLYGSDNLSLYPNQFCNALVN